MTVSSILLKGFQVSALATAMALVGCGGGGGGNDTLQPEISNGPTNTNSLMASAITLTDVNAKPTTNVGSTGAKASVKVVNAKGRPVSGAIVTFKSTAPVTFSTSNGAVLTNADGIASIAVQPSGALDNGAHVLSAVATFNGETSNESTYNFLLQAANISFGSLSSTSTSLETAGSTVISLVTTDAATNQAVNDVVVNFTASCGTFDNVSVTSSGQGNVSTTYKAIDAAGKLCEGPQTITATTANGTTTQNIVLNVAPTQANAIRASDTPVNLATRNSGSSSSGKTEFTVYANGTPVANQQVKISKNYAPGDFSFGTLGNQSEITLTTDANGKVNVNLYPGNIPGPVELKATLVNHPEIYALSRNIAVSTGRASQNGISISMTKNVLAKGVDGDTSDVTVRLVDRQGNAVPDGTVVSFVAEGGKITPNCSTKDGACTVTFSTQNPRPLDDRISILAYLEGDKAYNDANGNNVFDIGEPLTNNIGGVYRDDNENNQHNLGEYVYIRPVNGTPLACGTSTFYQPNLISQVISVNPLQTITHQCDNQLSAVIRSQFVLGLGDNVPTFVPPFTTLAANTSADYASYAFKMYGNSAQTVSMPSGTTITAEATDSSDFSPAATLVDLTRDTVDKDGNPIKEVYAKRINVSGAQPNSTVKVDIGGSVLSIPVDANGVGYLSNLPVSVTTATVIAPDNSCTAEIIGGNSTVPNIVNLGVGKVADSDVSYRLRYKGCSRGDSIQITTVTPAPSANTHIETVYVQ